MPTLDDQLHGLLFDIRRSVRYHSRRRSFFERLHKFTAAVNVISGSATFVGLIQAYPVVPLISASIVTIVSTIDLVIGSSQMAREHGDLARSFISLEMKITSADPDLIDKKDYLAYQAERLSIEAKEPPAFRVLDALSYNETCRSLGNEEALLKIGVVQAFFAQWIDLWPSKIKLPGAAEGAK